MPGWAVQGHVKGMAGQLDGGAGALTFPSLRDGPLPLPRRAGEEIVSRLLAGGGGALETVVDRGAEGGGGDGHGGDGRKREAGAFRVEPA